MFVVVIVPLENFHSYGDVTIAGEGLQILTYAQHSWPMSCEGSLTCHTYYDMGLPFIMFTSEDPWHSHLLLSVWQWSCHYLFLRLRSVALGIKPQSPACEANALPLRHRVLTFQEIPGVYLGGLSFLPASFFSLYALLSRLDFLPFIKIWKYEKKEAICLFYMK